MQKSAKKTLDCIWIGGHFGSRLHAFRGLFFRRFGGCLSEGVFLTFVPQRPPNRIVLEVMLVTCSGPGGNVRMVLPCTRELDFEG